MNATRDPFARLAAPFLGPHALRWILLLALVVIGAGLGLRDPWPADEPRFALVAKQMLESGNWLIPQRGIEFYSDKPPVLFWIQAALLWLTGSLRIAFLLPSLLAALGTLALVFDLARRLYSRRAAAMATLGLLFTLQFTVQAKSAQIDGLLVFWTTLSIYGLLRHFLHGPAWGWYLLAGVSAGIGVITKGVGFLPVLMLLPYVWLRWRQWPGLAPIPAGGWRWLLLPAGLIAGICIWVVPLLITVVVNGSANLQAYAEDLLLRQTAQRYLNAWHHHKPWWYFAEVIATLWLPLAFCLPAAIAHWRRRLIRRHAPTLLLLGWVLLVLLFFSASPGKRDVYILPALPAFALALAPLLPGLARLRHIRILTLGFAALLAVTLTLASIHALGFDPAWAERVEFQHSIHPWWITLSMGLSGCLILVLSFRRHVFMGLAGVLASIWLHYGLWAYPALNSARSADLVDSRIDAVVAETAELALVDWKEQILLQIERPVVEFGFRRDRNEQQELAHEWLRGAAQGARFALVQGRSLTRCFIPERAQMLAIANRREWYLVSREATREACGPRETAPTDDGTPSILSDDD